MRSVHNFPIIVLCGSTRYYEQFDRISLEYTLNGWIVLSNGSHRTSDKNLEISKEQFEMLEEFHRRKIVMVDQHIHLKVLILSLSILYVIMVII